MIWFREWLVMHKGIRVAVSKRPYFEISEMLSDFSVPKTC